MTENKLSIYAIASQEWNATRRAASQKLDQELAPIKNALSEAYTPGNMADQPTREALLMDMWKAHRRYDITIEQADKIYAAHMKIAYEQRVPYEQPKHEAKP